MRWERLGRIALLVNSTEILTKSLPEASRSPFWSSWGSFWASWAHLGPPGAHSGPPGTHVGPPGDNLGPHFGPHGGAPGALLALPGRSRASKIAPGGPPGGLPRRSSILGSFWGPFWLHFWTPKTLKISVFVWKGCIFRENREVRKKTPKRRNPPLLFGPPRWLRPDRFSPSALPL